MTWLEFKKAVEEKGISDSDVVAYVDWSGAAGDVVDVERYESRDIPGEYRFWVQ